MKTTGTGIAGNEPWLSCAAVTRGRVDDRLDQRLRLAGSLHDDMTTDHLEGAPWRGPRSVSSWQMDSAAYPARSGSAAAGDARWAALIDIRSDTQIARDGSSRELSQFPQMSWNGGWIGRVSSAIPGRHSPTIRSSCSAMRAIGPAWRRHCSNWALLARLTLRVAFRQDAQQGSQWSSPARPGSGIALSPGQMRGLTVYPRAMRCCRGS